MRYAFEIIKCSEPGFKKQFEDIKIAKEFLEEQICASCLITESDVHEEYDGLVMSDSFKSDSVSDFIKIQMLLNTPCGCEFDFDIVPLSPNSSLD